MIGIGGFGGISSSFSSFANRVTNSIFTSFGCPSLSSLGLNIGSIIKMMKSDHDDMNVELKDVTLQTSTYNKVIPEVFGQVRLAGNLMWCSEIKKTSVKHSQKITKNGTQSAYVEYLVRGSFAIAVCKGVIDEIKNIYADGEPLNLSVYNIKIYNGDDAQTEDPTMQSYLGTDIPAFRGLCYVVFTEFPMEEFGGRIPNLTFDVVRRNEILENNDMENLVSAVTVIPGSGEFVYDTITQEKSVGNWVSGVFYETSKAVLLNNHTASKYTDSVDSLNDLQCTFSNLKWVSIVVCWFCDNINSDYASVYPACENRSANTSPDAWKVAGQTRLTARTIGYDENGVIRYGGTPSDDSITRFVKEIKSRGLKLCLYPMLMVDVEQKPWRGHITGSANEIHNFFVKQDGYNNFIKHYVNLLKDDIDAVIIGSEMKGLTSVYNEEKDSYPAVDELCNLATEIRKMIRSDTKITYAADWSEYHHDDFGNYNLDKLWACKDIDYIGIDAYFPLTDVTHTVYDVDEIKNGWRSGEGWDFYYVDENRTKKADLAPEWAWKNVEYFWENEHYKKDGTKTDWVPKSKKIWFTEYGFPSVDCCTNQPNVFYSRGSYDSSFPRYSNGSVDFKAQRIAIVASILAWQNSECVEEMFLYTWDARPYPYFPNLKDIWADSYCWKYGHFLNGKSGATSLANIINYLCKKVGLDEGDFDTSLLKNDMIDGYIVNDKRNILNHLRALATAYNFDAFMDGEKIYFKSLDDTQHHIIDAEKLIIDEKTHKLSFEFESTSDTGIPSTIEFLYIDLSKDYTVSTAIARDNSRTEFSYGLSVPIPMDMSKAQEIAWRVLSNFLNQKTNYLLRLPISFLNISPLDTISISCNGEQYLMRVKSIEVIDCTTIQMICNSIIANDNILSNIEYTDTDDNSSKNYSTGCVVKTNFDFFELYNVFNKVSSDTLTLNCAIWSDCEKWNGASIYYSDDDEKNYYALMYVKNETSVGKLISINHNKNISPNFIDKQTKFFFSLFNEDGKLQSLSDEDFFQMKNKILIGNEVIAFRDVTEVNKNIFQISYLLRGRFNTEDEIMNHKIGEKVILLDSDFISIDIPLSQNGATVYFKVVSNGDTLMNTESKKMTLQALNNTDFDIKNLNKTMLKNGDILLSFSPRKKYKLYSNANGVSLTNNLMVMINNKNGSLIRKSYIQNTSKFIYSSDMQIEDFGRKIDINDINYDVKNLLLM